MELVVDANILISAFLKASLTRMLLLDERLSLIAPEHLLSETRKVIQQNRLLRDRTGLSKIEFEEVFDLIISRIKVLPKEEYQHFLKEALMLASHKEDAPYLAVARKLKIPIWSNDTGFKQQNAVQVYSTQELSQALNIT